MVDDIIKYGIEVVESPIFFSFAIAYYPSVEKSTLTS